MLPVVKFLEDHVWQEHLKYRIPEHKQREKFNDAYSAYAWKNKLLSGQQITNCFEVTMINI